MIKVVIADDFSFTPGPRLIKEGDFSGELFRQTILLPKMREAIAKGERLLVVLDGTAGCGTSFLEESFAGLIRKDGIDAAIITKTLEVVSIEEPWLIDEVWRYIKDAS